MKAYAKFTYPPLIKLKKMKTGNNQSKKASVIGIIANITLFIFKIIIGLLSNSIAMISEALNSFMDIVTSFITFFSVKIGAKEADDSHPFGHKRAEPIAGLIISIFAAILGIEVIRAAIGRMIDKEAVVMQGTAIAVLAFTMIIKALMAFYFKRVGREERNPAIFATAIDCRNDVLVAFCAIAGIAGTKFGYPFLDPAAALFVAAWILISAYKIGKENIDYLVGKAPPKSVILMIEDHARKVKGVKNAHHIRAHYVGNALHVELHIVVKKDLTTTKAHSICENVQKAVESLEIVDRAFVHVEPWTKQKHL